MLFQLILQVVFLLYEYTGVCVGVRCMEQSAGYTFEGAADKRHEGLRDKPGKGRPCLKNEILTKEGNALILSEEMRDRRGNGGNTKSKVRRSFQD